MSSILLITVVLGILGYSSSAAKLDHFCGHYGYSIYSLEDSSPKFPRIMLNIFLVKRIQDSHPKSLTLAFLQKRNNTELWILHFSLECQPSRIFTIWSLISPLTSFHSLSLFLNSNHIQLHLVLWLSRYSLDASLHVLLSAGELSPVLKDSPHMWWLKIVPRISLSLCFPLLTLNLVLFCMLLVFLLPTSEQIKIQIVF